jgi:hypothetical protein
MAIVILIRCFVHQQPTHSLFMYGWFTALMCAGSCVGAVAWFSILMSRRNFVVGMDALEPILLISLSISTQVSPLYPISFQQLPVGKPCA